MQQDNWPEIKATRQFTMEELEILTGIKNIKTLESIARNWKRKGMKLVEERTKFLK